MTDTALEPSRSTVRPNVGNSDQVRNGISWIGGGIKRLVINWATIQVGIRLQSQSWNAVLRARELGWDWCPGLPRQVYTFARNVCLSRKSLMPQVGTLFEVGLAAPFHEELIFRFGMQELLLKQLPKWFCRRFAPSMTETVDHVATKTARVAVSAIAFSLIHAMPAEYGANCSVAKLVHTFGLGILAGAAQEVTGSTWLPFLLHYGFNVLPSIASEARLEPTSCPVIP